MQQVPYEEQETMKMPAAKLLLELHDLDHDLGLKHMAGLSGGQNNRMLQKLPMRVGKSEAQQHKCLQRILIALIRICTSTSSERSLGNTSTIQIYEIITAVANRNTKSDVINYIKAADREKLLGLLHLLIIADQAPLKRMQDPGWLVAVYEGCKRQHERVPDIEELQAYFLEP